MSSKDSHLYNPRPANLRHGKEISSSNSLAFTSNLSSLINSSTSRPSKPTSARLKPKKDDLFHKPNRHTAKRAKLDLEQDSPAFGEQKHTTDGESLEKGIWERSQKKMQEKARLYAAMKRGDVEDVDERYAVDFDRKWAETHPSDQEESSSSDNEASPSDEEDKQQIEYTDEFGRTRTGTRLDASRSQRILAARSSLASDRFTSRPSAPTTVIHGDTIQHTAWQPDSVIAEQIEELAAKRDKSLTPPPEQHFDAKKEVRSHGMGFFQFSGEEGERKRQMRDLERERKETERVREEKEGEKRKRAAEEFLEGLGVSTLR